MGGVGKVIRCLRQTVGAGGLDETPDQQLLEQFIRSRDDAAFAVLLRRHAAMVWGVCRRLLFDRQDAEDAFQATFVVLVRKAASIRNRELLANWLFGVARRAAANARALRARRAQHEQVGRDMPDAEAAPAAPPDDGAAILDEELAKLPEKYRLPLLLCGLEGMSHSAAGRQLGWPTGTVAGRVARGRALLRSRLQRRGVSTAVVAALLAENAASAAVPRALIAATIHSATLPPAAVSAQVAALVHSVLKKMLVTRHAAALALTVLATAVLGVALAHLLGPTSPARVAASPPDANRSAAPAQPAAPAQARPKPSLELPKDPNAVVVRLERFVPPMDGLRTRTTIYASGRMTVELPKGLLSLAPNALTTYAKERAEDEDPMAERTQVFEQRLTPAELEDLMRFALHEQEFFEFRPDDVKTALQQRYQSDGSVYDPGDATNTQVFVRTAAQEHGVEWSRLTLSALRFKEVSSLAKLHALDRRLRHLFAVERAGGKDQVAALVQRTNELAEWLYQRYPHVPRLTVQDLAGVKTLDKGAGTRYTFGREKTVARVFFAIEVDALPDGDLKIHQYKLP